jgi:hypothetical protein
VFRYLFQTTVELYTVVDYLIRICVSWCLWRKGEGYKASLLNSCSGIQSIATWTLTSGDVLKEDFINVSWATYQACGLTRRAHTICNFWCCGCSFKLPCDVQRLSPVTGLAQHVPTADDRGWPCHSTTEVISYVCSETENSQCRHCHQVCYDSNCIRFFCLKCEACLNRNRCRR